MQMISGGESGRTHFSDNVSLLDLISDFNVYLGKVSVKRDKIVSVVYYHIISVASAAAAGCAFSVVMRTGLAGTDNRTGLACVYLAAVRSHNVHSLMV